MQKLPTLDLVDVVPWPAQKPIVKPSPALTALSVFGMVTFAISFFCFFQLLGSLVNEKLEVVCFLLLVASLIALMITAISVVGQKILYKIS